MKKQLGLLGLGGLFALLLLALGQFNPQVAQADPSPEVEICDNKIDDDKDGLTDCKDPDCKCEEPAVGCSPGYWKNHKSEFDATCGQVSGWTCAELWTAITCKGSDASCRRQAAASALNAVSGCTE